MMSSLTRFLRRSFSTATASASASATTTNKSIGSICGDIYREKDLKLLVQKFKKSSDIGQFRRHAAVYNGTVRRLANAKRFRWIEEILEHQKQYEDMSKEGFAARLISLYGKAGMFENAQKVFDEMPERNCKQSILSFNSLLGACVHSNKFDEVDGLFKNLPKKLGIEPDLVSYNTVIKAFVDTGSWNSANKTLDEMEKKGINPNVITYNTLLYGLYRNELFADAEKIWDRMVNKNVKPDIKSYNAKLNGLAMEKKTKEAVELVEQMRREEINTDVFTFNALIKGFVNEGNLEGAKRWYENMEESGCTMNKETFKFLAPFICEKGDLKYAFELCKKLFNKRSLVDEEALQLVVDSLAKASRIDEAKELVELGKTNNYCRYKLKLSSDE